jgi:hypothetical protein
LEDLDKKYVHFYDKQHRYFTMNMGTVLRGGLTAIQAFKREMGMGQRVVKLKHGTPGDIKKQVNNWAYFYICLSLSTISNGGSAASSRACSQPLATDEPCSPTPTVCAANASASKALFPFYPSLEHVIPPPQKD